MPPATHQKTPEMSKRPPFEVPLTVESKKSFTNFGSKSIDCSPSPGGAGEIVAKKPVKKYLKVEEEKPGKKVSSAVMDRVPKKNAQRAKGSTSLNKTIEKTSAEPTEKKKPPAETPEKTEDPENPATDAKKVSRNLSKPKRTSKKESRIPRTPQSWMNAKLNEGIEKEKLKETPCEEVHNVPPEEIRTVNGPFSSCSFFEKIQQGVKAYFSSRNSFTPGEKNKKGGSQTRARVANGVKEDATKREPGFVFKNKISDSFHERLRVKSLGGDSGYFSRAKPVKIFQKLKRKKLYRPKKHCVRIQIPRKGYFYRSTVQFKAPGPTTSGEYHRVDPLRVPKNEPKVQISGLASTGSKKPDLPNKKRLKKKESSPNAFKCPDETAFRRFTGKLAEGERQKSQVGCDVSVESVLGRSFETLVNCLSSTLDKNLIYDLEITPVRNTETVFAYNATAITETPIQIRSHGAPEQVSMSPPNRGVKGCPDPFNPTAILMDGIDLHSELQNYLKAFDSKSRFQNPNKFDEIKDNVSTFESATSIPEVLVMLERDAASASEECLATVRSQTEIRKIKSDCNARRNTSIKRTYGRTSFENLQLDNDSAPKLSMNSIDSYEKILPLTNFNSDSRPKNKSGLLCENIVYALPDESDANQSQTTTTAPPTFSESCSSEIIFPNANFRWSPTLQDLTEIYDSVLKHHQKMSRDSRNAVTNCISTHLISFLNEKLKEKQLKSKLVKLSKNFNRNFTPKNQWKPFKGNNAVKGYVSKFQELLLSKLSIKQITRLNKIISALQSHSEKNQQNFKQFLGPNKENKLKRTPKKQTLRKPKEPISKPKPIPKGKIQIKKLSSPKKLDYLLRTFFNSEEVVCTDPDLTDVKHKVLVSVKLQGNQVLVNSLTYFDSESVLSKKTKPKGTSELIIENVTKDQVTGFWYKTTKSSKLREQIHSKAELKPEKTPKKVKPIKKVVKFKKIPKMVKNTQQRQENELESFLRFNYDQALLRTQHPIDAIIESSESKLSGLLENEDKVTELPEPEIDPKKVKEALNDALAENVLPKEFFWDFRWMEEEEMKTPLTRTKSSMIRRQTQRQTHSKKKKRAEAVRSMMNLKNENKRHVLPRPRTAVMCFPSMQKLHKTWKDKKPEGVFASPPKTPVKPELSATPSRTILYLNSDVIPECCSIELLFSEDKQSTTSKVSVLEKEPLVPESLPPSQDGANPPIVLHPHNTTMADSSFPSMIIRSDTFLKCIPHSGVSLFKSNSDMKFYPGRLPDSEAEEKPFVTFVLTPKQKEEAEVSENQIQVVNKTKGDAAAETEKEAKVPNEETGNEVSLESIERFINELSKCRARIERQKLKNKHLTTKPEKKPKPVRTHSTPPKNTPRKKALLAQMSQIFSSSSPPPRQEPKPPTEGVKLFKKTPTKVSKKSQSRSVKIARNPVKKCERPKQKAKRMRKKPEANKTFKNDAPKIKQKQREEDQQQNKKFSPSGIPPEVVEALKIALAQAKDFPNKSEIVAAIDKAFDKPEMTPNPRKKLKVFKIKILCNEHKCLKESKDAESVTGVFLRGDETPPPPPFTPRTVFQAPAEIALLDSLVTKEEKGNDLDQKDSTYFDAVERIFWDDWPEEEMGDSLKVQVGTEDDRFLKYAEEAEDIILQKISDSLKEEDISCAMRLLDLFLSKNKTSPEKSSAKLKKVLLLVENKCKNLIIKIERNAWLEVLSLLEEVSQLLKSEEADLKKAHIKTAKDFLENIQGLNVSRLINLKNFCGSPENENVLGRIRDSLELLRQKFSSRRCELEGADSESQLKIHSTMGLPAIKEAFENKSELERLKKKTCIESEDDAVPPEVQNLKIKVAEKMKDLKKMFADFEVAESCNGKSGWRKAENACSSFDCSGRDKSSSYTDLMQSLMKDDEDSSEELTTKSSYLGSKSRSNIKSTKSLARVQNPSVRILSSRNEIFRDGISSSTSKTEPLIYSKSREKMKQHSRMALAKGGKVFSTPEFLVNDCWKAPSAEIPVKLVEIFKENDPEEKDSDFPVRKRKFSVEEDSDKLTYTKEFHVLTEVQKAKILTAVEDVIKKLGNTDVGDLVQATQNRRIENPSLVSDASNIEKYLCKKFLLPWVIMKLVEMVLCHLTLITFLSNDVFFLRKNEFLPVVVTYYLTLFVVVMSLVLHIGCYSYVGIQNPCYFMGIISSSILTLTTTLGILIILCSMEYYKSFSEILVLVFIGTLIGTLVVELCICYIEVKNFWSRVSHVEPCYIP